MLKDQTNPANIIFGKNILLATSIGTAVLVPIHYEVKIQDHPQRVVYYESMENNYEWETRIAHTEIDPYKIESLYKINAIKSFSNEMLDGITDLDDEILEALNKTFWDLV